MKRKIGTALVAGAGISGIRAALDLAEFGYGVTLIDRSPHIGGILSRLDYQFPTDRCGMCKMLPLADRDMSSQYCLRKGLFHENIEILLSTEIISLEGEPGHFRVMLRVKPSLISPELCIGCGECTRVCPVEVPDEFNTGLSSRKAVYLPVPHAVSSPYVIDTDACTRCGACEGICPSGAIRLSSSERRKFRILVVDDELIVRDSLKEWLDDEGFSVSMAASGPEALEILAKESCRLMLVDIKMSGMDGVEVLKKAKEAFPDLQVIMMTAYATVETAVEAMKIGASDYLIKPFDPRALISMVLKIYENLETSQARVLEAGAVVLCGGVDYFNPAESKNPFCYGVCPNVVSSLQFERILSGTGPSQGRLIRPGDGKAIRKAAWIQCTGSRDLQTGADFCSNVCCMYAIKECLLALEKAEGEIETTIFYMDMRTFGKSYQRYRDYAESRGVRFERSRIHSVIEDKENKGNLILHYMDQSGRLHDESFDTVILPLGQRPAAGMPELAEMLKIPLNPWGFAQSEPFSLTQTGREGIVLGGSFSGLKDIGESVIQAGAAALSASRVIHAAGGSVEAEPGGESLYRDVSRELPKISVIVCTCGKKASEFREIPELVRRLETDPSVCQLEFTEGICTSEDRDRLVTLAEKHRPNRILVAACLPYIYSRKVRELAGKIGLDPALAEAVQFRLTESKNLLSDIETGIAKLRQAEPGPAVTVTIVREALVVGGGIAGMTAALGIADHGFRVYLIEQAEQLGGNLLWLKKTLEGYETESLLNDIRMKVEKHPLIQTHLRTRVIASYGQVGCFYTTVQDEEGITNTLEHGLVIIATGGTQAPASDYGYGTSPSVITQKELEQKLADKSLDPQKLAAVVMIQCVGSREEPRNYCSRVCCATSLKHALTLKSQNPDTAIYVLYRDMMSYGFTESYFTQARKAGVIFIQYDVKKKPGVRISGQTVYVTVFDPILGSEVEIESDLLVLATGIVPTFPEYIAQAFGASADTDGFFQEAESKWRPVDSLKEGVFGCGIAHSPRSIAESVATSRAAAQRALRILSWKQMPAGKISARVRHSLCSLCERCIAACPYGARSMDPDSEKIVINPVMCQGCGSCAVACPNSASVLDGYSIRQMLDVIDAAFV